MTIARDQTPPGSVTSSGSSVVLTWGTNPAAGAKVLVAVYSNQTVTSVADNGSTVTTFTDDTDNAGAAGWAYIFRGDAVHLPSTGSYKVTVTFSASASGILAAGRSYTGAAAGAPAGSPQKGTASGTSGAPNTGNVTPPAANSLIFGFFIDDSGASETITLTTSGANSVYSSSAGTVVNGGVADNIPSGTSAQDIAWSLSDSVDWGGLAVTYSPAGVAHTATASDALAPSETAAATRGAAAHTATASLAVAPETAAGNWPDTVLLLEDGTPFLLEDSTYLLTEDAGAQTATAGLAVGPALTAAASKATAHSGTASLAVTPAETATAEHSTPHTATAGLTVTPAETAQREHGATGSATLGVGPATAAEGGHPRTATADLSVTPAEAAHAEHGATGSAALGVTPATSAEAEHGHSATASLSVTPESTATAGHSASLDIAPALEAEAQHGHAAQASLSAGPSLSAEREHGATAQASLEAAPETSAQAGGSGTASLDITPDLTATAQHGHAAQASLSAAPETSAEATAGTGASLPVGPSLTAQASRGQPASASLDVTPAETAAREHGATASATADAVPSETAAARHGHAASASLGVAPGLTAGATSTRTRPAQASLGVAPGLTAAAAHGHAARASLAVTPVPSAVPLPPFPASPVDARCEFLLSGTWTDVSAYAYQRDGSSPPVTVTRGRPDESSQANPAVCTFELNNRDGRFSPRNPLSPYYGQLARNTPVRWSVPAAQNYLRTEDDLVSGASCPNAAPLRITGDLDVRADVRLTDQAGAGTGWDLEIAGANWQSSTEAGWMLGVGSPGTGQLIFSWSPDGTSVQTALSTVPAPLGRRVQLRAAFQVATGTVTFYTASSGDPDAGPWTQLGDPVTSGATTLYGAPGGVQLAGAVGGGTAFGGYGFYGATYGARVYSGIGGTLVASPDFTAQAAGAASFADAQGNTWTLSGTAEISDRDYRFHGEMSQLPPKWDVTGRDMSVMAQAGGPLRRMQQGTNNAMSAMKRAILLQAGDLAPVAYWPMEDNAGASVLGSATGGAPVTFSQNPAPSLSSDSTFTASAPLPSLNGSRLQGAVPAYAATGTWTVRFLLKGASSGDAGTLVRIVAGAVVYVNMESGGDLELIVYAPDGTEYSTGYGAFAGVTTGVWCSVEAQPADGGGVQYSLVTLEPGASSGGELEVTVSDESAGAGTVRLVQIAPQAGFASTVVGHLQVQSAWASLFDLGQPLNAWTGETAAARYARLSGENGYACRITGAPAASALMGPQGQATLQDLLQECETADLGQQYEPRQQLALGYRTLASMCGQSPKLTLDYTAGEPGGVSGDATDSGLDPTYDDLLSKNDWTVTRGAASGSQGATVQVQLNDGSDMSTGSPPDGIGDYANTQTVNTEYDSQLQDVAGWMVHTGTVDDLRWPAIPLNLARSETAALRQDAMDLDAGDMIQVGDAPDLVVYDPVKQLALGFRESFGGFHYTIEFNAVPEVPYETVIFDDPVYGRVDTDGSALASGVSSTATTLSVATDAGFPLWTTAAADFPFDIAVGGERITVTDIAGTSSPQSFTVTRSVNGVAKAQSAGADVRLWFAPVLALT